MTDKARDCACNDNGPCEFHANMNVAAEIDRCVAEAVAAERALWQKEIFELRAALKARGEEKP